MLAFCQYARRARFGCTLLRDGSVASRPATSACFARHLVRLRERCDKKLSEEDTLYQAVYAAYDAVFTLRVNVHYLECDAGRRERRADAGP